MRVLVSGAGVAGPCLAFWLRRHGLHPTLVERAPAPRTGGYLIDFWGAGFDVAERMGIVPAIMAEGYRLQEFRQVDRAGKRISSFPLSAFERMSGGRFVSLPRSALAAAIYRTVAGEVETIFDDSVTALDDVDDGVQVAFERSPPRRFDLVIGADGLHSQVRRLRFGEAARFERFLGLKVAAFSTRGYPHRDELIYVTRADVGQQVGRFTLRDDETMFLFTFADGDPAVPADLAAQRALVRGRCQRPGWEYAAIAEALDRVDSVYVDRVSQIHLARWSQGRVALVGDAAFCASLLSGRGTALAMIAAYVLAGELARAGGDHQAAFAAYEARLRPYIESKQRTAVKFAPFFAPPSRAGIFLRNQMMKLMTVPFLAERMVGRELRDRIELPDY